MKKPMTINRIERYIKIDLILICIYMFSPLILSFIFPINKTDELNTLISRLYFYGFIPIQLIEYNKDLKIYRELTNK